MHSSARRQGGSRCVAVWVVRSYPSVKLVYYGMSDLFASWLNPRSTPFWLPWATLRYVSPSGCYQVDNDGGSIAVALVC